MRSWMPILVAGALMAVAAPVVAQEPEADAPSLDDAASQLPDGELMLTEVAAAVRAAVRDHMSSLRDQVRAIRADFADEIAAARAAYADGRAEARLAYDACIVSAAEDAEARAACRAAARERLAELRAEAALAKDELMSQLRIELAGATSAACDAIASDVEGILVERNVGHLRLRAFVQGVQLGKCGASLLSDAAATDGAPTQTPVRGGVSVSVPVRSIAPSPPAIG